METQKHKIYAFNNGGSEGWYQAIALGDDGVVVGEHICSHEGWIPHDLGADGKSNWHHEGYDKHFGAGNWEIEYIQRKQIGMHQGLKNAIDKASNRISEGQQTMDCERAGVTVVTVDNTGKETTHKVGA